MENLSGRACMCLPTCLSMTSIKFQANHKAVMEESYKNEVLTLTVELSAAVCDAV